MSSFYHSLLKKKEEDLKFREQTSEMTFNLAII